MKQALKLVLVVLLSLSASIAFAQHRGGSGQRGGYNNHGGGYNGGHQYNGHNVQRHNGPNFGNVLLGTMAVAGTAVVLNSIFNPQPVYYQQPIVVDQLPAQCSYVQQYMTDPQGRPLYDQYSGQPLVRQVRVCSSPVPY